ncbi:virion core protein [Myxoma virus]|nr:virion core protein [Myxoma virus]AQT36113.1 virion core protein [Myxoma virus]AQT36283.1 virion core protein [Myxoma virus]AQT36453.1 virion core protein [Myxoma virus]AQT36623.1 virion core protein [Myxoma virus]
MDFMVEYEKWIDATARNTATEEDDPNPLGRRLGTGRTRFESSERQYQQQLIEQLRKQQMLRIEIPQELGTPSTSCVRDVDASSATSTDIVPVDRRICTVPDIQKELDSVKTETCSLQRQSEDLISDISMAKDSTFGAINALMDDLRKRFQSNQLSELTP